MGAPPPNFICLNANYGYEILDPTSNINRKQRLILDRKKDGALASDGVQVHGAVTAIANYQTSNRAENFGYLMRHPTSTNHPFMPASAIWMCPLV